MTKIRSLLLLALLAAPCLAVAQTSPAAGGASESASQQTAAPAASAQSDAGTTLKVDVKLVNVFVTVVDQNGAPVRGLNKDNFQIMEDGVQNVAVFDRESELPLNIVLA